MCSLPNIMGMTQKLYHKSFKQHGFAMAAERSTLNGGGRAATDLCLD